MKRKPQNNKISQKVETKRLTQLERVNQVLIQISPDVTTEDRKSVIESDLLSEPHLIRYLRGKGTKLTKALDLLEFLRERISAREKKLARA